MTVLHTFRYRVLLMFAGLLLLAAASPAARAQQKEPQEQQGQPELDQDDPAGRERYLWEMRALPGDHIPEGVRLKALREVDAMQRDEFQRFKLSRAKQSSIATSTTQWTQIGPRATSTFFYGTSSGRVTALAVDPGNSSIVYLGAAQGGVWKSTDAGATFSPVFDGQASLAIGSIVIDPNDATHQTIWVGTGEQNFSSDSYYGAGVFKSTNGGANWTQLGASTFFDPNSAIGQSKIGALAVKPGDSQTLLAGANYAAAASNSGIYRSTDGGANWTHVQGGATATALFFDPTTPTVAYAALGSSGGQAVNGIYKSTDSGATWLALNGTANGGVGLPAMGTYPSGVPEVGRIAMAIAPSSPSTIYAAYSVSTQTPTGPGNLRGVFKTTNAGANWTQLTNASDFCTPQCWYDMVVAVNPANANVVYLGGSRGSAFILQSLDGGTTWTGQSNNVTPALEIHPDMHAFGFSADGTRLYIGNDGGASRTDNPGANPVTWTNLNGTLNTTQFYSGIAIDPTTPNITFGGTQDNGTQRYSGSLQWDNVNCGDGGASAIDPTTPLTVYSSCQGSPIIEKATDGGLGSNSFHPANTGIDFNERRQFIPYIAMDPSNSQTLYFGTYHVWQTTNGATSWVSMPLDLTKSTTGKINYIAVAPSSSDTVYTGATTGAIFNTNNATAGASAIWLDDSKAILPPRVVTAIAVNPTNALIAYATYSGFNIATSSNPGHVFKTVDGGQNWTNISSNLPDSPVNAIVVDPDLANTLYLGTDVGVFRSQDDGASWQTFLTGLPKVAVFDIKLHRPSRTLRAATHGRGMWDAAVPLPNPVPVISTLSPSSAFAAIAGLSMTVNGTGNSFVATSIVRWNGSDRSTVFVNANQLSASITAADLAAAGTAQVTVFNPAPGGGTSSGLTFTINAPALGLSPASVDFGTQIVGSRGSRVITLNSGASQITVSNVAVSGSGFQQSNNCGVVAAGNSCSITVTFQAGVSGTSTGSVTVTDTGAGSPRTTTLTGFGANFTLTRGGRPQRPGGNAMVAGDTLFYNMAVTSDGYDGPVDLSCGGAPRGAACEVMPARVGLSKAGSTPITVVLKTRGGSMRLRSARADMQRNVTPAGNYTLTIKAQAGSLRRSASVAVTVVR